MAIVVSHMAGDFQSLASQALRQAPLADLIELRLDRIGNPGQAALADFVAKAKKPVIVTVHTADSLGPNGHFEGGTGELLTILETAAAAGVNFVDVDWRLSLDLGELEGKCHRIVSRHELGSTPEDLMDFREEVLNVLYEGDLIKLVTHAESSLDGLRMLNFVREVGGGLIGFCSGAEGAFTRQLAPIFGSPFTYAAPAEMPGMEASATAPGQIRVNDLRGSYPPGGLTPETAIFGVLGSAVANSASPRVHGMGYKAARLDAMYVALETADFPRFLELCADENWRGFSITAPYKERALAAAHSADEISRAAGACNTLVRDPRGWQAFNTDVPAIRHVLNQTLRKLSEQATPGTPTPSSLDRARTLVLGAGGAARAAGAVVSQDGGELWIAARRLEAAQALAEKLGGKAIEWDAIPTLEYDVLIHTTPVGSELSGLGGELPIPEDWIRRGTVVLDAVYLPLKTPLLMAAIARGCTAIPGAEWFLLQAVAQFKRFTRTDPDEALMRAALEHALLGR